MAVIFVTHDLGVVADLCSRVIVMYAGQVVEEATVEELFARPAPPLHRGPARGDPAVGRRRRAAGVDPGRRARRPSRCRPGVASTRAARTRSPSARPPRSSSRTGRRRPPRRAASASATSRWRARSDRHASYSVATETGALLSGTGVTKHFPIRRGVLRRTVGHVRAVDGVDLAVEPGRTVGLVGESGSGKSTLGRVLLRLLDPTAGTITFDGADITKLPSRQMRERRRGMQLVFQDPFSSFDPLATIADSLAEPMRNYLDLEQAGTGREELVASVGFHGADLVVALAVAVEGDPPTTTRIWTTFHEGLPASPVTRRPHLPSPNHRLPMERPSEVTAGPLPPRFALDLSAACWPWRIPFLRRQDRPCSGFRLSSTILDRFTGAS